GGEAFRAERRGLGAVRDVLYRDFAVRPGLPGPATDRHGHAGEPDVLSRVELPVGVLVIEDEGRDRSARHRRGTGARACGRAAAARGEQRDQGSHQEESKAGEQTRKDSTGLRLLRRANRVYTLSLTGNWKCLTLRFLPAPTDGSRPARPAA